MGLPTVLLLKDLQDCRSIRCGGKFRANRWIVQKFGDRSQGAQMGLELILRHKEQNDEVHGLPVEGFKIDPNLGTGKAGCDFLDRIAAGMGNRNPKSDSRAHRLLAMTQRCNGILAMGDIQMPLLNKTGDNLLKCLPPVRGTQLGNNLIFGEETGQGHR